MKFFLSLFIVLFLLSCSHKGKFHESVLKRYNSPVKTHSTDASWAKYKRRVLTPYRVAQAKRFMRKYHDELERAERVYGVDKEVVVAFLSIESSFCSYTGNYPVYDVLWTLAYHKNRKQKFFRHEFEELLKLAKEEGKDPHSYRGSFAGAMGCVQQLPSVHRRYGVDFDGDGVKDLYSIVDSIGAISYFMQRHGWKKGAKIAVKTTYKGHNYSGLPTGFNKIYDLKTLKQNGIISKSRVHEDRVSLLQLRDTYHDELWLGLKNMRVLTAYNNSTNYGMSIFKLSQMIRKRGQTPL